MLPKSCRVVVCLLAFVPASTAYGFGWPLEASSTNSQIENENMATRNSAGLRGPVRAFTEETTYMGDAPVASRTSSRTIEFDTMGREISSRSTNSDGSEFVSIHEYDADGRLDRDARGNTGQPFHETIYSYSLDEKGRVVGMANTARPDEDLKISYDDAGRKTEVRTFKRERDPKIAVAGSPLNSAQSGHLVPSGGSVTTIYDSTDQATEAQIRDSDGTLVGRVACEHDGDGRRTSEKYVIEDAVSLMPRDMVDKYTAESGISQADLKAAMEKDFKRLLGPDQMWIGQNFRYDDQGRVVETQSRMGLAIAQTIRKTYNEKGDLLTSEETTPGEISGQEPSTASVPHPKYLTRYHYQYDSFGNWTEQISEGRLETEDKWSPISIVRRKIEYY